MERFLIGICIAFIVLVGGTIIDLNTGELVTNRKAEVTAMQFEPEHLTMVGKTLMLISDKWHIWVSVDGQEPDCYITQDFFHNTSIGDKLVVDYKIGIITGSYHIELLH